MLVIVAARPIAFCHDRGFVVRPSPGGDEVSQMTEVRKPVQMSSHGSGPRDRRGLQSCHSSPNITPDPE